MPTTDYLLTVMRMKGAQDMARDLATVGDKYQELSARAEAASRILQHQAAEADKTKKKLEALGDVARISAERQEAALGRVADKWAKIGSHAGTASNVMGGAAVAGVGFGAWLVKGAMQAEGAVAQLKIALKDDSAAKAAYKWAKDFADVTPFITQSVVEASARLQISKLDMREWTAVAGNMAAPFISSGKDITDAVEAIRDAVAGGGLERLKEFGITGSMLLEAGAAKASGGGVSVKTKEDVEKLKEALKKVVEMNFGNAMEESFKTAAGGLSTLQGNIETFRAELGKELLPDLAKTVATLTEWVGKFNELDEDTRKQIISALKYGVAIAGIGAAVLRVVSVLATWKSARAAAAAANIARNLAEAQSANALALAYERAGGAAALGGKAGVLRGIGATGANLAASTAGRVGLGTATAPLAVSGMGKLINTVAGLAVPLAAIAGGIKLINQANEGVLNPSLELGRSLDNAQNVNAAAMGTGQVWTNDRGERYSGRFPSVEEFTKQIINAYNLPNKEVFGKTIVGYPDMYDPWRKGETNKFLKDMERLYGVTQAGSVEPVAKIIKEAYANWYAGFSVTQMGGQTAGRAQAIAANQAAESQKTQEQQDADERARNERMKQELSAFQTTRETQQKMVGLAGANIETLAGSGLLLPSLRSHYGHLEGGGYQQGRTGIGQFPQSIGNIMPHRNETFDKAWQRWRESRMAAMRDLVMEFDQEQAAYLEKWDDRIFQGWEPDKQQEFGGWWEWRRQKRDAHMEVLARRQQLQSTIVDFANAPEEEIIKLVEAALDGVDTGLVAANEAMVQQLRDMRDAAVIRMQGNFAAAGRYGDRWQLNANALKQRFDEFHADAAKEIKGLQDSVQKSRQWYEDALAYEDMKPGDYDKLRQQMGALGLSVVGRGSKNRWREETISGFKSELDKLSELMSQSTGAMLDHYREIYEQVAREFHDFLMKDTASKKWEPHIAREIIATGGLSGLVELAISRKIGSAVNAIGKAGLTGPYTLSGPAAERVRANGGLGRAGDYNALTAAPSASTGLPGMPSPAWIVAPKGVALGNEHGAILGGSGVPLGSIIPSGVGGFNLTGLSGNPVFNGLDPNLRSDARRGVGYGVYAPAQPPFFASQQSRDTETGTIRAGTGYVMDTFLRHGGKTRFDVPMPIQGLFENQAITAQEMRARTANRSLRIDFYGHADSAQEEAIVDKAIDGTVDFLRKTFSIDATTPRMAY